MNEREREDGGRVTMQGAEVVKARVKVLVFHCAVKWTKPKRCEEESEGRVVWWKKNVMD